MIDEEDHDYRRCHCESCTILRSAQLMWMMEHEDRMYEQNGPKHE